MNEQNKSSTIMYTVNDGYTVLVSEDKQKARQLLEKNRDIIKPLIKEFNGEWHKDTLSSFPNPSDAVHCALEIQKTLKNDLELNLRIGIHTGHVVFGEADGVKVASGIGPLAEPGSVCISDQVYYTVRNQTGVEANYLGEKTLENVDRQIKVYAINISDESEPLTKTIEERPNPSIAVLPFIDMSPEKDQEYFCDGVTEEIINALSHIQDLHVVARTSAFSFKGKDIDIREIGHKLNVETVLEGSIRKAGNRIRITSQLIKIEDGYHLWSEKYDRELEDIFAIQDEVSLAIVESLKVKLLKTEKSAVVKRHTEDLDAYNLYLKGCYQRNRLTIDSFKEADRYYREALKIDSHYSLAFTGLSDLYVRKSFWGNVEPHKTYPKAREAAEKALEIDNCLSEAHDRLGSYYTWYEWNWIAAEREFKHAIELKPNLAEIHMNYSWLLQVNKRHDEAIAEMNRAMELDPLSPFILGFAGSAYYHSHRYKEVLEILQEAILMDPHFFMFHFVLGITYMEMQMLEEAIEELEKAVKLSTSTPLAITMLATAYYRSEKKTEAHKLLQDLYNRSKKEYIRSTSFAIIHLARGEVEEALQYLDQAVEERDGYLPIFTLLPPSYTHNICSNPHYKALLKKMGLPED